MERNTYHIHVHGYKIRYESQYAIETLIKSVFNENDHWFKTQVKRPYIIDAGAHYGCTTLYLKKHFPLAEILCFEPDSRTFAILKDNVNSNALTNVRLLNIALGEKDTMTKLYSSEASELSGGLGNSIIPEWGKQENAQQYTNCPDVEVRRLSQYIERPVDYLKLDIEAAEHEVLPEIEDKLHLVKRLFIEIHCTDGNEHSQLKAIMGILERNNFSLKLENESLNMPPWNSRWTNDKRPVMFKLYGYNQAYLSEKNLSSIHASKVIAGID